jgi:hypothetical protein
MHPDSNAANPVNTNFAIKRLGVIFNMFFVGSFDLITVSLLEMPMQS